jgi:Kef-type K+ transport system membrane component KefB/nucleotide-binding universal stress UspA family protein
LSEALRPLGGHAVFLLLIQLALLLTVARVGAELAKRAGLPAVVGELAAGIALGPSLFGHYFPDAFAAVFPPSAAQFNLLDVVGTLGMTLLLLLTGLETDLRLLKNLGRAALIASLSGMVLPFALGFGLGMIMPDRYVAQPDHRILFALFLATAMAISAMPVIAKILMDLDLTKRNIGLVILSAGVVDDTAGWLVLSIIAGAASHGGGTVNAAQIRGLALTIGLMLAFCVGAAFVLYPILRVLIRWANERFKSHDTDLVVLMVVTFICSAATEKIGIHAVFGAFVAGTVFRQVPRLRAETVHRLEAFVFSVLAPVFFGIVGLKVDLWKIGGGRMLGIVLAVACLGKLIGVTLGGLWSGMRFWEASSIAVAMNARGAMELVVASIGLSLGILNQQMFSIIVVVAITTSFMAPIGLRLTMRRVRMTKEEEQRILAAESKGAFDPDTVRVLIPTAGGPNALGAARLALGVARKSESPVTLLFVEEKVQWWDRVRGWFSKSRAGQGLDEHVGQVKKLAGDGRPPEVKRAVSADVARTIVEESERGYDLVLMGASQRDASIGGDVLADVVGDAACHVAILRAGDQPADFKRLLVPVDGGIASRVAVEFAHRYAEVTQAELTIAMLTEQRPQAAAYTVENGSSSPLISAPPPPDELERISRVFRASDKKPEIIHLAYDPSSSALFQAVESMKYDLVVIGAENRAIQNRLFFGYENERLVRGSPVAVLLMVPRLSDGAAFAPSSRRAQTQRPA